MGNNWLTMGAQSKGLYTNTLRENRLGISRILNKALKSLRLGWMVWALTIRWQLDRPPFWKDDYWLISTGLQYPADWHRNTRTTLKFTRSLRPISCPKPCIFVYAMEQRMKSERGRQKGAKKQDRQCTYNLTLRPVRAAIVAVEKQ